MNPAKKSSPHTKTKTINRQTAEEKNSLKEKKSAGTHPHSHTESSTQPNNQRGTGLELIKTITYAKSRLWRIFFFIAIEAKKNLLFSPRHNTTSSLLQHKSREIFFLFIHFPLLIGTAQHPIATHPRIKCFLIFF